MAPTSQPTPPPDPHRRHRRPRALARHRVLPPAPRDPAPRRGRRSGASPPSPSRSSSGSRSLFEGRAPQSLQAFVVSYLRYSVQVSAYLHLAAAPVAARSAAATGTRSTSRSTPSRRQSRGRVAARLVLALPVLLLAAASGAARGSADASWAGSHDSDAGWSTRGRRRRPRGDGRVPRVVRVARAGADAARPARPRRLRHRLHGAGRAATCSSSPIATRRRDPSRVLPGRRRCRRIPVRLELDRPARAVAPDRLLPAPARDPAPRSGSRCGPCSSLLAVARRLGRRARDRARADRPPPLHRRLGALRDARRRLPLPRRRPVPGLRRRRRELPRRPRDRPAAAPAPARHPVPALARRSPRSSSRRRYTVVVWVVAPARLVGGALHRADAGGDPQSRRRRAPLLAARRTRTSSCSPTGTRTRRRRPRPPARRAARARARAAARRIAALPESSPPEPRRPRRQRVAVAVAAWLVCASLLLRHGGAVRRSTCPAVDVDAVFGKARRPRGRARRALLPRHLGRSGRSRSSRRSGSTRGAGRGFARESAAGPIGTGMLLGMLGLGIVWLVELPFTLLDVWWARRHDLTESGYLDWAFEPLVRARRRRSSRSASRSSS